MTTINMPHSIKKTDKDIHENIGYLAYTMYEDEDGYIHHGDIYTTQEYTENGSDNTAIDVFNYDEVVGTVTRTENEAISIFHELFGNDYPDVKTRVATRLEAIVFGCDKSMRRLL